MFEKLTSLKVLQWVIRFSILLIGGFTLWFWLDSETMRAIGADMEFIDRYGGMENLTLWQRIAGLSVELVPALLLIAALLKLDRLLILIKMGKWFERQSEEICTSIGRTMLWYLLASFLDETILILIFTAMNEPGKRELAIGLSSDTILGLIPALMAFVIAQLFRLMREQRDELNEII